MFRLIAYRTAGVGIGLITAGAGANADPLRGIAPHRAVYDMTLASVSEGSSLSSLNGRLVYDLQGTVCDGFTVNFRLVTQFANTNGESTTTDLRSSTFEEGLDFAAGTGRFSFLTRNLVNQISSDETAGLADRTAGQTAVSLDKPEKTEIELPADIMFPTEHLGHLLEAAAGGKRVFQARIYDGSEDGATINETTAIIGEPQVSEGAGFADLETRTYWPVTLSYYDEGATGDQLPNYEISFNLFENGVSDTLTLDYGEFAVSGALSSLDFAEAPEACE